MRAAVLEAVGESPHVRDFEEPHGDDVVTVTLAGCNPVPTGSGRAPSPPYRQSEPRDTSGMH